MAHDIETEAIYGHPNRWDQSPLNSGHKLQTCSVFESSNLRNLLSLLAYFDIANEVATSPEHARERLSSQ